MTELSGLVKYERPMPPVPPGHACEGCGSTDGRLVRDHCHEHGWVRGLLCDPCNLHAGRIDRRFLPSAGPDLLAALLAVRNRCTDCAPLKASDLRPFKAKTNAEAQRDWRNRRAARLAELEAENDGLRARVEELEAVLQAVAVATRLLSDVFPQDVQGVAS